VLRTWDFRLARAIHLKETKKIDLMFDAFNLLNRPNVDEVTPVYGSPVFCGGAIPRNYKDATSIALQHLDASAAWPAGPLLISEGSLAPNPIGGLTFIPSSPNPSFGKPRTMLNPRQLQFAVKFSF